MSDVITMLDPEDLVRSRQIDAKSKAIVLIPAAYGWQAIEDHYTKAFVFNDEMMRKYSLPADGNWYIDSDTGAVMRSE